MKPPKTPKGVETQVESQLKRFFSEREQFIDTIRNHEEQWEAWREELNQVSPTRDIETIRITLNNHLEEVEKLKEEIYEQGKSLNRIEDRVTTPWYQKLWN